MILLGRRKNDHWEELEIGRMITGYCERCNKEFLYRIGSACSLLCLRCFSAQAKQLADWAA